MSDDDQVASEGRHIIDKNGGEGRSSNHALIWQRITELHSQRLG